MQIMNCSSLNKQNKNDNSTHDSTQKGGAHRRVAQSDSITKEVDFLST